jgi:ankyrin repeat protein
MMFAARAGSEQAVDLLLNHGADVNAYSSTRKTALYLAQKKHNSKVERLLIQAGARDLKLEVPKGRLEKELR